MTAAEGPALSYSSAPGRWVVAITVLGSGIAALDATVVNIALPTIGRDFHTGIAALQWVMTSYILTLAAFLLIGGSLGDRFGRRRVYLIGIVWFALASAACGFAPNADFLIITRVLQGIGGALLTPGSLAILEASFAPADRGRAIGAWSGLGGVAIAAGPLIGGYLIAAASWRWIFFINIPIAAAVVVLGARHIPESRDPAATGRLDYAGALAAVVFLAGITFAFIEAPTLGWGSPTVLTMALLGVAGLIAFLIREQRAAAPMLPLSIFADPARRAAVAAMLTIGAILAGYVYFISLYLQKVQGYSPVETGLALLPSTLTVVLTSTLVTRRLLARIDLKWVLLAGLAGMAAGQLWLGQISAGDSYPAGVLPGLILTALGIGLGLPTASVAITAGVRGRDQGLAGALFTTSQQTGAAVGLAVLATAAAARTARTGSLVAGYRLSFLIGAGIAVLAAAVVTAQLRTRRAGPQPAAK
jgi:EmrB/QacA subfamily drug resistance transporter